MTAYYNEIDPYAAQWLRNLIAAGHIAPGIVDERSIVDVQPGDLEGFTQCHFFAGLGGWSYAARLAGWPDDRPLWSGSCPCQPLSGAGQRKGHVDERHLWPAFFGLIAECRPAAIFGEQVASPDGREWFAGVRADLETVGYACGAAVVPACAVGAPHRRERLWFVADAARERRGEGRPEPIIPIGRGPAPSVTCLQDDYDVADAGLPIEERQREIGGPTAPASNALAAGRCRPRLEPVGDSDESRLSLSERQTALGEGRREQGRAVAEPNLASGAWRDAAWLDGADGKARRVKPGIRLLAYGVPARVGKLRALGNAIVPQVAAEVIGAFMECQP